MPTVQTVKLDIPKRTPSLNDFGGRNHWTKYHRLKNSWADHIQVAKIDARCWGRPEYERVRLVIERHAAIPIKDDDNLYGGLKPVLDALVRVGLLKDDSRDVIVTQEILQIRSPRKDERTIVRIFPLEA